LAPRAHYLAKRIQRTVTGPMWHGPALDAVLAGVTATRAAARSIADAHTIWEIVLHVTAWAEIARLRLRGEAIADPPADRDWPPMSGSDPQFGSDPVNPQFGSDPESAWAQAVERLGASHRALAADVRALADERLDEKIAGLEYTVQILLAGVIEHGAYHGGQIALLKKA
jgi:DinB superfamily